MSNTRAMTRSIMVDLKHGNVCSILGVCMQQRPWLAVLEYVQYGDLREVRRTSDSSSTVDVSVNPHTFPKIPRNPYILLVCALFCATVSCIPPLHIAPVMNEPGQLVKSGPTGSIAPYPHHSNLQRLLFCFHVQLVADLPTAARALLSTRLLVATLARSACATGASSVA